MLRELSHWIARGEGAKNEETHFLAEISNDERRVYGPNEGRDRVGEGLAL